MTTSTLDPARGAGDGEAPSRNGSGTPRDYEPNMVLATRHFDVVGTRPVRHDGADKVTGRAMYGADLTLPDTLHGAVLRSPHAHARILSVETSKALAMPGVRAVVTADDLPPAEDKLVDVGEGDTRLAYVHGNILASGKTLYQGHAVAAVAARNAHIAEQAAAAIEVEYEPLDSSMTAPEAMADGAELLHPDLCTREFGKPTETPSNVAEHFQWSLGDVEEGFRQSSVVKEATFDTATVHQGYIEPHNVTALWNHDGRLHIWCSTQGAFVVRDVTAKVLEIPVSNIKVTPMEIGGGFGGKIPVYLEPVAALLSRKTGRPVKIVMTREDVLTATGPTAGSHVTVKIGASADGKLRAMEATLAYEAGAYPGSFVVPGGMCVFAAYDCANVSVDCYDVVVNKPSSAAYRAPGAPQAAFATEQVIDDIARELGLDPVELRLRNRAREGSRRVDGPKYRRIGCEQVLRAVQDHPHYSAPLGGPNRGRGVAVGFWFNVGLESSCTLHVSADGNVHLVEGSTDIGGTRTSIAMQAAEVLGVSAGAILPEVVDTDSVGFTSVTGGSRTTFATGWAAHDAAQKIVAEMRSRAAKLWGVEPDAVEHCKGVYSCNGNSISFRDLAANASRTGGPISATATAKPRGVGGSFSANIVDVEVDPETGKVSILRFTAVQDVGKAVHPSYVEGQMQGGSVQGIGWALNEEYFMGADGRMQNSTLLDYRMPTSLDLPMIDTCIVEVANPGHPFGVRGVGEANIVPPPAAIANAVRDAVGVRMRRLPMSPPAVWAAVSEASASGD